MKVMILLNHANKSWIIEKIADKLCAGVRAKGVDARISDASDDGSADDIVHHMSWAFANTSTHQNASMFITHLDDRHKMNMVRKLLSGPVKIGVCMSSDTKRQLIAFGVPERSLCVISPAHDSNLSPRKIVIGITSKVYPDGRKREHLLKNLANKMRLDAFEFRIFGSGWAPTAAHLEASGASVRLFPESSDFRDDYKIIEREIPFFDYYLYLGLDEGSLGALDALQCGVPTIITPQGFHLDIPEGISHPVLTGDDLISVFLQIASQRPRLAQTVAQWTWAKYAETHVALWKHLLDVATMPRPSDPAIGLANSALDVVRQRELLVNSMKPRRLLSAISHTNVMRPIRVMIDKIRFPKRG